MAIEMYARSILIGAKPALSAGNRTLIEASQEPVVSDEKWFKAHPSRQFRLRLPITAEVTVFPGVNAILVRKLDQNAVYRERMAVVVTSGPSLPKYSDSFDIPGHTDEWCCQIWLKVRGQRLQPKE